MGVPQNGSKWLFNSENCINQWIYGDTTRCQAGRSAPSRGEEQRCSTRRGISPVINCGLIFLVATI